MRILSRTPWLIASLLGVLVALAACGSDAGEPPGEAPVVIATETEAPAPVETATQEPKPAVTETPPVQSESETSTRPLGPPDSGQWIDVNVSNYTVRLMNGTTALEVIGPVGVGEQINTGVYESTQTGLFYVYSMDESLTYDAPYETYISHWVGFDPALANGFHSFLKDADGNVVDASTGRISNGCIRTGTPEAIYAFAEIGMPVYVHF